MKTSMMLFSLLFLTSCQDHTPTPDEIQAISLAKEQCKKSYKHKITEVDGCEVFEVYYDRWDYFSNKCYTVDVTKMNEDPVRYNHPSILYTSCPKDSVKWDCGKNCTKTNTTQLEKE